MTKIRSEEFKTPEYYKMLSRINRKQKYRNTSMKIRFNRLKEICHLLHLEKPNYYLNILNND